MSDKSLYQQFVDTKCRDGGFLAIFSQQRLKSGLRVFLICGVISTLTFFLVQQQRLYTNYPPATISLIIEEDIRESMQTMSYDCSELNRLLNGHKYEELEAKYPDNNDKIAIKTLRDGETVILSRRPLLNCLEPDHPFLIKALKLSMDAPPSPPEPYYVSDLDHTKLESQQQALDVMQMVYKNNLTNGFFLEAGAQNCVWSVTLPIEANYGWKGLLVEMVPDFYNECLDVGRRAHIINTCLGTHRTPHFIDFDFESVGFVKNGASDPGGRAMAGFAQEQHSNQTMKVQCFPVYSLLLAMDNPTVNLFVLDIEGYELAILRTIPWDKVDIEVISVETDLAGLIQKDSSPELITQYLEERGYTRFRHRNDYNPVTQKDQNHMFVRNDVVKKYNVIQLGEFP